MSSILKVRRKPIICNSSSAISFWTRIWWSTVSKAFWKSIKIPQAKFHLSNCCLILSVRWIRAWGSCVFQKRIQDSVQTSKMEHIVKIVISLINSILVWVLNTFLKCFFNQSSLYQQGLSSLIFLVLVIHSSNFL